MSWESILGLLAGGNAAGAGGAEAGAAAGANNAAAAQAPTPPAEVPTGNAFANTLLGSTPRTDSVSHAVGDFGKGLTDPNGLLGQMGRILATIGGFAQGGAMGGLKVMDFLQQQDQMSAAAVSKAAAENMSWEEANKKFPGMIPRSTDTVIQAKDMPASPTGLPSPSMGTQQQVISPQLATPADLEAYRDQEFKAQRASASFGEGMSPDQMASAGARSQRLHLPTDFMMNNEMTSKSLPPGGYDPGLYETSEVTGPEGKKVSAHTLGPLEQSFPYDVIQHMEVPDSIRKVVVDDPANQGRAFVKFVSDRGDQMSVADYAQKYAMQLGKTPEEQMRIFNGLIHGGGSGTRPKGFEASLATLEAEIGRPVTAAEGMQWKTLWSEKSDPLMEKAIGTNKEQKVQDFISQLKGAAAGGQGTAALTNPNSAMILEEERNKLYKSHFGVPNPQATPGADAVRPAMGPGTLGVSNPPSPETRATPAIPSPSVSRKEMKVKPKFAQATKALPQISQRTLDALATKGPKSAGEVLGVYLNEFDLSKEEKGTFLRSLVDQLPLDPSQKLIIEKAVFEELD